MVVYNFTWGVAWFTFMRREWENAYGAIRQSMPWTAEVWFLWVVLTMPIGMAIMAYASSRASSAQMAAAVSAAVAVWLLMALGMAVYGWQERLSVRVITLDSTVNLFGMVAASIIGGWSERAP